MKCPKCSAKQKFKDGRICKSCKYQFALNPKAGMHISDRAFQKVMDRLSGPTKQQYFTYDQLYAELYKSTKKKSKTQRIVGTVILSVVVLAAAWIMMDIAKGVLSVLIVVGGAIGIFLFARRPLQGSHAGIQETITQFQKVHPISNLVDGTRFKHLSSKKIDSEVTGFAPERILIVEHRDVADMLIMNRFHVENKALVVSQDKYPEAGFAAYREFIDKDPYLPISLMHDCSRDGIQMHTRLERDRDWNLVGKNVQDLGLNPKDVDRVGDPIWRPFKGSAAPSGSPPFSSSQELMGQGYRVPLDTAPPKALMPAMGLAMVLMLPMLSEEILARQKKDPGGGDGSGGFG